MRLEDLRADNAGLSRLLARLHSLGGSCEGAAFVTVVAAAIRIAEVKTQQIDECRTLTLACLRFQKAHGLTPSGRRAV